MGEQAAEAAAGGLPVVTTAFIGRGDELASLHHELSGPHRLVTLVGPGGIGKTRLAVRAAERYPTGDAALPPLFVPLAALDETSWLDHALLDAAGLSRQVDRRPLDTLTAHIDDRPALVVLDNCEHLPVAVAEFAEELLLACPQLRIIATSREPLGVVGEAVWPVGPLPTRAWTGDASGEPDTRRASRASGKRTDAAGSPEPARQVPSQAAQLFLDRAATVGLPLPVRPDEVAAVERIVAALNGIPLAIELVAARTRSLTPLRIAEKLDHLVLSAHDPARPVRHRSMRRALDWSHALLDPAEAALFGDLSVFVGDFTLDAVRKVCGEPGSDVIDTLLALIEKSLVEVVHTPHETRYRMLSPVRHYAAEHATAEGPRDGLAERHCAWYLALAERADRELWGLDAAGQQMLAACAHDFRAALDHACRTGSRNALRLGVALSVYWRVTGRFREAASLLERALASAPGEDHPDRARALAMQSTFLYWCGELEAAARQADAAEAVALRTGDVRAQAHAAVRIGTLTMMMDPPIAEPILRRAIGTAREADDLIALGDAYSALAATYLWQSDFPKMAAAADSARALGHRIGYNAVHYWAVWARAQQARIAGDLPAARQYAAEGMEVAANGDAMVRDATVESLALIDIQAGDAARAHRALTVDLERPRDPMWRWGTNFLRHALATAELALGDYAAAQATAGAVYADEHDCNGYLAWHAKATVMQAVLAEGDASAGREHAEELRKLAARLGNERAVGVAGNGLARAALLDGDVAEAERCAHTALAAAAAEGWWVDALTSLELLAVAAARQGRHERAVRLFHWTAAARTEHGVARVPEEAPWWQAELADSIAHAGHLPDVEDKPLSLPRLVEFARRGRGKRDRPDHGPASLTPMESNVARLVAGGATNADVAAELFISRTTVHSHLRSIFVKLGVANRTQLAARGLTAAR